MVVGGQVLGMGVLTSCHTTHITIDGFWNPDMAPKISFLDIWAHCYGNHIEIDEIDIYSMKSFPGDLSRFFCM